MRRLPSQEAGPQEEGCVMDDQEIVRRLLRHFGILFPDKPDHRPLWNLPAYKPLLFAIFRDCYESQGAECEGLILVAIDEWRCQVDVSESDESTLDRISEAWGEWFYAAKNL